MPRLSKGPLDHLLPILEGKQEKRKKKAKPGWSTSSNGRNDNLESDQYHCPPLCPVCAYIRNIAVYGKKCTHW